MKDSADTSLPAPPAYTDAAAPSKGTGPSAATAAAASPPPASPSYYQTDETRDFIPDDFKFSTTVVSCEPVVRRWFMRKVYTLLSCQILFSFAFSAWVSHTPGVQAFILRKQWLFFLAMFGGLVSCVWLTLAPRAEDVAQEPLLTPTGDGASADPARAPARAPWYCLSYRGQLALLGFFTFCEAYTLSLVTVAYNSQLILSAMLITGVVVVAVTAMALSDRFESTVTHSSSIYYWLNIALWLLIGVGFSSLFFGMNSTIDLIYSWLGATVFTIYLFIDTQMIFRKVYPDEEIRCAMMLYLDIINLFLYILRILGRNRDD
ncbi:Bax inhibitor 1 [Lachancea thermotolerans]|uniref:KLTH0F18876p n=1 Tax=Lachancea thermotolerans (strain ATCC 56472 / CBS 6340 / NRRL Y-8284) TaxID=559295 RepID=C5DJT0_LACTC|nr:KLTH0F18876p [Lachancea thermotolerans CBS 6340]CAR24569.1 KLTH0F18876p [Lachancea thermotolerans CBS 6340]